MTYTVKYKNIKQWFWRKIEDVIEDGVSINEKDGNILSPYRWFTTKQDLTFIIPTLDIIFQFSLERAQLIQGRNLKEQNEKNRDPINHRVSKQKSSSTR